VSIQKFNKKTLTVLHSFFAGCQKFLGILSVPLTLLFPKTFFGHLFHKEALTNKNEIKIASSQQNSRALEIYIISGNKN
jgi:hypothetical protein